MPLREDELQEVLEIVKREIALALKPKAKEVKPAPEPEPVKAEHKKGGK